MVSKAATCDAGIPCGVPAAPPPLQLLANGLEKVGLGAWTLSPTWETQKQLLAPGWRG